MKLLAIAVVGSVVVFAVGVVAVRSRHIDGQRSGENADTQSEAVTLAKALYVQQQANGTNFSNGPCLGAIMPDWVVDIVHDPRTVDDNKLANQCAQYVNGIVHHFVELDLNGKLIRVQ